MALFVLIADLQVKPESVAQFVPLILANANASVHLEPGCLQFDVTQATDDPTKFALYEVYADAAAFEAHGQQPHVAAFFEKAKDMIVGRGARRLTRLAGFHKH
jgi:autoinducer 2-degrading protein